MNRNHLANIIVQIYRTRPFKQGIICQIWYNRSLRIQDFVFKLDLQIITHKILHKTINNFSKNLHTSCTKPCTDSPHENLHEYPIQITHAKSHTNVPHQPHTNTPTRNLTQMPTQKLTQMPHPKPCTNAPHKCFILIGWLPIAPFQMLNLCQSLHKVGIIIIKVHPFPDYCEHPISITKLTITSQQ